MKNRNIGQTISFYAAFLSYIGAVACFIGVFIMKADLGFDHPITSSFMASVFFFITMGIVLQVIGTTDLPSLRFDTNEKKGE
ncbi:MAG: hypothetical protein L3J28_14915 [Candidatus Polarisedimenticolaceae bacterium]|nr:hypothetical protein [Candidatus Polarisedimenticolaceae bacterium]